jgi:exosome complex component RRP46
MSSLKRKNGRQWNQLRTLSVELGVLNRADGSVKYTQGDSTVLVAVYGPAAVQPKHELPDRATIEVVFKPRSGLPGTFFVTKLTNCSLR